MSDVIGAAVAALQGKMGDRGFDGSVRFDIEGEGSVRIDENGVRADDSRADCTISADLDTFRELIDGNLNPTGAFMSGRLRIAGDMGLAMRLASVLG